MNKDYADLIPAAEDLLEKLKAKGLMVATAESCTGGLICGLLTEVAGSSAVVDRGFVTYSNEAKSDLLGVPVELIARHGAVSKEVAVAMAEGALARSRAQIAVSVTGIAGPGGGSEAKPVGTVHIALARTGHETLHLHCWFADKGRTSIRAETVSSAFMTILNAIE
ncbi:CinA family protein [Roseibium denhamense]|uniref:Nicotinamide-nucleotide amidase n=1 Tax=Roseibium denhamense TaxID=76305 RepID=A0ABY1NPP3_9HYPH|nr:CinA family protein [Roseibium denhamense]MTI07884.1 CinA family protein [Roseibium denhamense]SMP14723.1 nicotinamide-nucleotide amidase [Roseibium denhamense]